MTEFAVTEEENQGEVPIDTLSGEVLTSEGEPVVGVSVQLLKWREGDEADFHDVGSRGGSLTWGDTNESGQFIIPIRIEDESKNWHAILEILATKGQTLRKLNVTVLPKESLDLGQLVCALPDEEWGGEAWKPRVANSANRQRFSPD